MKIKKPALGMIPFGTVYLLDPELTRDEIGRDLDNIIGLGFNTIVIWPAMSRWEHRIYGPAFGFIDHVMDECAARGLKVIIELMGQKPNAQEAPENVPLPMERPPKHPRDIPFNDPAYRELILKFIREVVDHFRAHPALLAFDTFNEIGNNNQDPYTRQRFAAWLKDRYAGCIRELNAAWTSCFDDFESIARMEPRYDTWIWSSCLGQRDWYAFRSWDIQENLKLWADTVKEIAPESIAFADALGCDSMHNRCEDYHGVNDWDVAAVSELFGISCYANMIGEDWWTCDAYRWSQFWRSSWSAAQGKQVIISEMMTQNRFLFPDEGSSMTDQLGLWSYQSIFSGIQGVLYWKYRPFRRGLQVAGRGLTHNDGRPNHFARQAAEVATFVQRNEKLLLELRPDCGGCALLFDHNTQNILYTLQPEHGSRYTDAQSGLFRGFWEKGILPAFLSREQVAVRVPDWVRTLVIPCGISLSRAVADSLTAFMRRGGVLLTESRFGLLDEDARLWPQVPGGGLSKLTGMEEKDFTCRYRDSRDSGAFQLVFEDDHYQQLETAPEVNARISADSGLPLLFETRVGDGRYLHTPILLGQMIHQGRPGGLEFFGEIFDRLESSLSPSVVVVSKPRMVDVAVLVNPTGEPALIGITNYREEPAEVVLRTDQRLVRTEGSGRSDLRCEDGHWVVALSARTASAVFLD